MFRSCCISLGFCFSFCLYNLPAISVISTLSLHDALPIFAGAAELMVRCLENEGVDVVFGMPGEENIHLTQALEGSRIRYVLIRHEQAASRTDRKSTRLNSSHVARSYAVFCLKKKTSAPPSA